MNGPAWVRTRKRAPGAPETAERIPGPWHTEHPNLPGQTWCGRHPNRLLSAERRLVDPPAGERRCLECEGAKRNGRPLPYRRGR